MWTFLRRLSPLVLLLALLLGETGRRAEYHSLVFINASDCEIAQVGVESAHSSGGVRNADGSPIKRGDSLPFDCEAWPAEVTVYRDLQGREALASVKLPEEPGDDTAADGCGIWYVIAQDGPDGLLLTLSLNKDLRALRQQVSTAGQNLGLNLSEGTALLCRSPGHGFQGDGSDLLMLLFPAAEAETMKKGMEETPGWHSGPMPETVSAAWRELVDWSGADLDLENCGGWYFRDEHRMAEDPLDPSGLFQRASFDFMLGLWDSENRTLVFYELHT